jgi:hypothetical protein
MTRTPFLTRSDAWIVAALCETRRDGPMRVRDLIYNADWLNRAILSYDELSFGLPRLEAAGLVEVTDGIDGPLVRATSKGRALRRQVKAHTLAGVLAGMDAAVGAPAYPERESEDRTLGRLHGFSEAQWRAEVAGYHRAFRADVWQVVAAGALAIGGAVGGLFYWWRRRRG